MSSCCSAPKEKPAGEKQAAKKKKKREYRQALMDEFFSSAILREDRKGAEVPPQHPIGKQPAPGKERSCLTCGHHKGRKSFAETCPRKDELLFNGGTRSASQLMSLTFIDGCEHATPKPEKPAPKKKKSKKESETP